MKKLKHIFLLLIILKLSHLYSIDGVLWLSNDYTVEDRWKKTIGETAPVIIRVKKVFRDQLFLNVLLMKDFELNNDGKANVEYDMQLIDPNNKVLFTRKNIPTLNATIIYKDYVQLGKSISWTSFDDTDRFGKYTVKITLKDLNTSKTKQLQAQVELVKFKRDRSINTNEKLNDFMITYYKKLDPEKAIDAYLQLAKSSKERKEETSFLNGLNFFLQVFNNNKYLIPHLVKLFPKQDRITRIYLIYLFRYLDYDLKSFLASLKGENKYVYDKLLKQSIPDPYGDLEKPEQLDMLWADFLATGSYKPILQLVNNLSYVKYKGALEKYKKSKKKTEKERKEALLDATYGTLEWSLESNIRQHQLVRDYCNYIYKNEKLSKVVKTQLANIIKESKKK